MPLRHGRDRGFPGRDRCLRDHDRGRGLPRINRGGRNPWRRSRPPGGDRGFAHFRPI